MFSNQLNIIELIKKILQQAGKNLKSFKLQLKEKMKRICFISMLTTY